jgi:hypothetical protein
MSLLVIGHYFRLSFGTSHLWHHNKEEKASQYHEHYCDTGNQIDGKSGGRTNIGIF